MVKCFYRLLQMGQGLALTGIGVPWPNSATLDFQFNVSCAECRLCVAEDGTQVEDDEYLATLPSQTLFILLKSTEKMVTGTICCRYWKFGGKYYDFNRLNL